MKPILDVIHEKEEMLRQRQQQVKMLEEQLTKLRTAADIIADDDEVLAVNAPEMMPVAPPASKGNGRATAPAPGSAKNWP